MGPDATVYNTWSLISRGLQGNSKVYAKMKKAGNCFYNLLAFRVTNIPVGSVTLVWLCLQY